MATPAIQTLLSDAQQVLNLNSISEVRSTMAVALANANVGTPLSPSLTTQQLWDEFYQVVRQPESDIESILANQLMKFLYSPPAPGGVGADKQVIFNDGGVLAGSANFLFNKATNLLTVTGSATITGDLTVDTSTLKVDSANNRVGIGTASPATRFVVSGGRTGLFSGDAFSLALGQTTGQANYLYLGTDASGTLLVSESSGNSVMTLSQSGVCTWYDGASGTRMTLNSTGLGVGTAPIGGGKISALGDFSSINGVVVQDSATTYANNNNFILFRNSSTSAIGGLTHPAATSVGLWGVGSLKFFTGASAVDALTIDASQNVGIGVTPSAWAAGYTALQNRQTCWFSTSARDLNLGANVYVDGVGYKYIATAAASNYVQYLGAHSWYTAASGTAGNAITFTQAMTLDASGNLFVGKTATGLGTVGIQASPSGWFQATVSGDASIFTNRLASDGKTIQLYRQTLEVGNISVTTTGATFNSTSDYRLKEAVAPLSGGLARVNALKPSVYKWKSNGLSGEGFLAHELAEVVPAAVNGEKDDVNEDGSIKAQSIDMSRVVPILVAAIQELTARVQTLETR